MAGFPTWAEELATLLPACGHFLVSGNTRDYFLVDADAMGEPGFDAGERVLRPFTDIVRAVLARRGIPAVVGYDVTTGAHAFPPTPEAEALVDEALGTDLVDLGAGESLGDLAHLVEAVTTAPRPLGLVVHSASRLVLDAQHLGDEEFRFFRHVDRVARAAMPGQNELFNPVLWVLDSELDVPAWFVVGNEKLRSIGVPLPDAGDRQAAARRFVGRLGRREGGTRPGAPEPQDALAEQTAGLPLVAMESIVGVAEDQGLTAEFLEDAARAYRVGILDNPWRQPYLKARLRREVALLDAPPGPAAAPEGDHVAAGPAAPGDGDQGHRDPLVEKVFGQEAAIRKSLDILVRSVMGMTGAHAKGAARPRGVLFFAGPTGVGKTELAKAITKLVFDDERLYIRFDMSEFSAEHAADRLIGAPPGYLGFERGGELTNAVRQRPFSLVLFDEIEKAHPLVLDKFLQLLDEGRLTDGRGETAHFSESIVVFTSNLGIYRSSIKSDDDGNRTVVRELNVSPGDDPEVVVAKVKDGINTHFTVNLGRPELLNRIGDNNIVVFDFIRPDVGARILDKMVGNVLARVQDEHQLGVEVGERALRTVRDVCLGDAALVMGGRGIGSWLESVLVNPLANELFLRRDELGDRAELEDLSDETGTWRAVLKPTGPSRTDAS